MSETTPESGPNAGVSEPDAAAERETPSEPATGTPASAAAEPQDDESGLENPPSEPVSARGHVNRPAESPAVEPEPAAVPAAPAAEAPPAKTIEPEPVVASHDDVAAAVARSSEPGAVAAGSATADTASPVEAATPVIVAAEAANLRQDAPQGQAAPLPPTTPQQTTTAQTIADQAPTAQQPNQQYGGPRQSDAAAAVAAPIFLQRPEPPKKRSNRGFGILFALVGTVVFAALWVLAVLVVGYLLTPTGRFAEALNQFFLSQIEGWVPVVAFFIGMVVLIQILNRARWWAYILGGLFVAIFVYVAFVGAWLYDAKVLNLNPAEAAAAFQRAWLGPFAVLAGVIAREVSVWTGAWLAARGRKLKARNAEAQADYEQQLADAQNRAVAAYAQPQGY